MELQTESNTMKHIACMLISHVHGKVKHPTHLIKKHRVTLTVDVDIVFAASHIMLRRCLRHSETGCRLCPVHGTDSGPCMTPKQHGVYNGSIWSVQLQWLATKKSPLSLAIPYTHARGDTL